MNKKSVTIDLSQPEGAELARRLAAISDVVIDNMRPSAMKKLGLGYDDLCNVRSDIIVVSSSRGGHEGPESNYLGFAPVHHAYGGGAYITGYPDSHPTQSSPGDVDLMNATNTAYATVAAIYHRYRTGEGQFIDYSQCEGVSSINGEILLSYEMTGQIPERMGNAHPRYAPHSVYKCWGVDRWLALEIHSDKEFALLADKIDRPELADDSRFADMASRKKNEGELNRIIESWTQGRDRDWVVGEFCDAGLAAAPSRDGRDLYGDPQLNARSAFITIRHPELGELELIRPPWVMSGCQTSARHAPLLGEHNTYVFKELLGLGEEELSDLQEKEIIVDRWPSDRYLK